MNKEYILEKLAVLTLDMINKAGDKLNQVNKYHLKFLKRPKETLEEAKFLNDDVTKLFLQQNRTAKSSKDVAKVVEKNLNTKERLLVRNNSKGETLTEVSNEEYALLKELEGANRLRAKKQLTSGRDYLQNSEATKEFNKAKLKKAYKENKETAKVVTDKAKIQGKVLKFKDGAKHKDPVMRKMIRKLLKDDSSLEDMNLNNSKLK